MAEFIIRCGSCGEIILQPYDRTRVQPCPACGHLMSLVVVDLAKHPEAIRHLKSERQAESRKESDT